MLNGGHRLFLGRVTAIVLVGLAVVTGVALGAVGYAVGPVRDVSRCPGQNAEVEEAVDPALKYVYEEWIGCDGIGFARSIDGGRHFGRAVTLRGSSAGSWDPAVTVAPNGTVYAAFMVSKDARSFPVVVASFDHGASFSQMTALVPARKNNWGDRDFIAAGPDNSVYVTWDYGPYGRAIHLACPPGGSCGFAAGDLNIVMQVSTDGGRTFGPMTQLSPGYPASGADSAPLLVEPSGRIDVLYQRYRVTRRRTFALGTGYTYFTSSTDGGHTWGKPIKVGAAAGTTATSEWWIDGAIGIDPTGDLYATWDTQTPYHDIGWLAYSTDHGDRWSAPVRVTPDASKVPHIVQAVGGPGGVAYVGWLTDQRPRGYAEYLRTFSITRGWLSPPRRISRQFGQPAIWPGDTFGISTLAANDIVLSWGSAPRSTHGNAEIFAARVGVR